MFDFLNRFGLPVKYAVLSFFGVSFGVFLAKIFGYDNGTITLALFAPKVESTIIFL